MISVWNSISAFMMSLSLLFGGVEFQTLTTPEGEKLQIEVDAPANSSQPLPALIIVPGRLYHKDMPIFKTLARKAVEQGFVVYRFNWTSYLKNPTNPPRSRHFEEEMENIRQVVNLARTDSRVDPSRIILAGKSMGSVLSYSLMQKEFLARGLVIITPLCNKADSEEPKMDHSYPDLDKSGFPILFLLGDEDPNCELITLGEEIRGAGQNVLVGLVGGNHYLTYGAKLIDAIPDEKDRANLESAAKLAIQWSKNLFADPTPR